MNEWSEYSDEWKQLSPDLTALAKRVEVRGRFLHAYMLTQAFGTVFVMPFIFVWAYRTVPTAETLIVLAVCTVFMTGWWAVAWPAWRANRAPRPAAAADQVRNEALRQLKRLRPLIALECVIGLALALYVAGLWLYHDGKGPWLIYAGGGGFAVVWLLFNLRYWLRLGREANELLGHST